MIQNYGNYIYTAPNDWLMHHGIKGQKWGIRRYQNPDGTLTAEGRERYGVKELNKKEALDLLFNKRYKKNLFYIKTGHTSLQSRTEKDKTGVYKGINNLIKDIGETRKNEQDQITKMYDSEFKKYFENKKVLKDFKEYMNKEYGDFDKIYYDSDRRDFIFDYMYFQAPFKMSKELSKKIDEYYKTQEETNKIIENHTNQLVGKIGNFKVDSIVNERNLKQEVDEIVKETKRNNNVYNIAGFGTSTETDNEVVDKLYDYWKKEGGN